MRFNDYYQIVNLTIEGTDETCVGTGFSVRWRTFRAVRLRKLAPDSSLGCWPLRLEGIRECVPVVASSESLRLPFFLSHQFSRHWHVDYGT